MERISKETVVAYPRYCPRIFLEGLRKPRQTSVNIADVPLEIQTEHLSNTSLRALVPPLDYTARRYFSNVLIMTTVSRKQVKR